MGNNGGNQKLKAWSFQLRKDYLCMLNIECPITHQSSITFFFYTPCIDYESLWMEISSSMNHNLICGVIYRHSQSDLEAVMVLGYSI